MNKKKYHIDERGSEGYERLGNEIVKLAIHDYRKCLEILSKHSFDEKSKDEIERIETFFHSSLYGAITTIDPDMIIKRIRGEYGL